MKFFAQSKLENRKKTDLLVLPFWKGKKSAELASSLGKLNPSLFSQPIQSHDFTGREGEVLILFSEEVEEGRLALVGLGEKDKASLETLRRAFGIFGKKCIQKKWEEISLLVPSHPKLRVEEMVRGAVEGLLLVNYLFQKNKNETIKKETGLLQEVLLLDAKPEKALEVANHCGAIFKGVYLSRDLGNDNADTVNPQYLAKVGLDLAKEFPRLVKTTVFDKKRIEKEKMGLLLAVNRGSCSDPVFMIIEYRGNPKAKGHPIIIGKGITYDTGGLNLKPTGSMETMRADMGGAAACLGTVLAAASLKLPINFTAIVASTENSIGPLAYKPGDVYVSYAGKTVEIVNTDAEGRLVLADALAYAVKNLKPTHLIDLATLTGAIRIALGDECAGLFSNDQKLAHDLFEAGNTTYERVWQMPMYDEYLELMESDLGDIKSRGPRDGGAGAISAAKFLEEFVGMTPWAHLDIAGTYFIDHPKRYLPKYTTGYGVRLLTEYLLKNFK